MVLFPWIFTTAASARWMARTIGDTRAEGSVAWANWTPIERLSPNAAHVTRSKVWLAVTKRNFILGPVPFGKSMQPRFVESMRELRVPPPVSTTTYASVIPVQRHDQRASGVNKRPMRRSHPRLTSNASALPLRECPLAFASHPSSATYRSVSASWHQPGGHSMARPPRTW